MHQIPVYIASKRRHAEKLKALRPDGLHFISRWLDTGNLASNAAKPASHWQRENYTDIRAAEVVLVYAEKGEHLVNALQEVGYAIAWGKPIYCCGSVDPSAGPGESQVYMSQDYEPWSHSAPGEIFRVPSLEVAFQLVLAKARGLPYSLSHEGLTPEQEKVARRLQGTEIKV